MGNIKDGFDDADFLGKLAKKITLKASKRALTRVLLMATVGIVILGSYFGYLTYLLGEYRKSSNEHNAKYGLNRSGFSRDLASSLRNVFHLPVTADFRMASPRPNTTEIDAARVGQHINQRLP